MTGRGTKYSCDLISVTYIYVSTLTSAFVFNCRMISPSNMMQVMDESQPAQMVANQSTETLLEWYTELSDKNSFILERMQVIVRELGERARRAKDVKEELLGLYRGQSLQHTKMISSCRNVLQSGDVDKQRQKVFASNLYFMAKLFSEDYGA
jgi:hypothetical protein